MKKIRSPFYVTTLIAGSFFMEMLDGTIIATAIPQMALSFHVGPVSLNIGITAYLLTLAVFIPISGWVADRFGSRSVFSTAIGIFTLGSFLCGISSDIHLLVACRILQGCGGAMMVPVGRLVILRTVAKHELVGSLAWLTVPALIGPVVGPPVGGFITTYFEWRWIFWINVPIGIVGVLLSLRFIENIRERDVARFDFKGFVLSGAGLLSLVFGLTVIGVPFMPRVLNAALVVAGLLLLALYVGHARRDPEAIVDLSLLKIRTFFAGVAGGFLFRIGIGAMPFLLPLLLQIGFGLTPFQSGSLTFASAAGAMAMKFTAATILKRWGFRRVLVANGVVSVLFLVSCGLFTAATPHWLLLTALLAGGFFRSLEFTALNAIGYADIDQARMSRATSFASVAQQMSGAVGVALAAASVQTFRWGLGDTALAPRDLTLSFAVVSLVALSSVAIFARLKPDAGAEVSGQRQAIEDATPAE